MVSKEVPEIPATAPAAAGGPHVERVASIAPVVVVDDDLAGVTTTRDSLAGGGYAVGVETDGDAVLRHVRASLTRLVVAELYVPCAEGDCLVAALKAERTRIPRLRVLVHTRHTAPADLEWALGAGADAVVPKPARAGVLLQEVGRLLHEAPPA